MKSISSLFELPVTGIPANGGGNEPQPSLNDFWKVFNGQFQDMSNQTAGLLVAYLVGNSHLPTEGRDPVDTVFSNRPLAPRHVLLEGLPGTAKTELTKACENAFRSLWSEADQKLLFTDGAKGRIQGSPDILPSDFLGSDTPVAKRGTEAVGRFKNGPIFSKTAVFHVDEINRISPRTLAVLFEAMTESQITISSLFHESNSITRPEFFLIATQNPLSYVGTNPIPEPLMDRFLFRFQMPYPSMGLLTEILTTNDTKSKQEKPPAVDGEFDLRSIREKIYGIKVPESVAKLIGMLIVATWPTTKRKQIPGMLPLPKHIQDFVDKHVSTGCGVRAGFALREVAKVAAYLRGRSAVQDEDVLLFTKNVLSHRIIFLRSACPNGESQEQFVQELTRYVHDSFRRP